MPVGRAASDVTDAGWWFGHPLGPLTGGAAVVVLVGDMEGVNGIGRLTDCVCGC